MYSHDDLDGLPCAVRRYFITCGYYGTEKQWSAQLRWAHVEMKFSRRGKWRELECTQFNAVPDPVRLVHMRTKIGGIFWLEARDKYQGGHGNMLIRLMRLFTLQDAKGPEMDESALVTLLAESLIIPAYAIQPYIRWSSISDQQAVAWIAHKDVVAHGLFSFDDEGHFIRFETANRYQSVQHGDFVCKPWRISVSDYIIKDGISRPVNVTAAWREDEGWVDYFRGELQW